MNRPAVRPGCHPVKHAHICPQDGNGCCGHDSDGDLRRRSA
ncbi:hypothetical protein Ae706Ps2_6570c [Pseudonocardia sp. Ae706_Ps2]|nr:hypothetical protein Ae706Ps2_6564c [Pseudonocardia sp. Ae706_Ps2]OLM08870.1 hypothetical protein Ae706Ps2_6570c [Pseudonocardia sp. Ae706_Ps2]